MEGQPNRTHVVFAHYGFSRRRKWEQSYRWFAKAWKGVLDHLADYGRETERGTHGDQAASAKKLIVDLGKILNLEE